MTATATSITTVRHAGRAAHAVSEGTESARRINSPKTSLTPEPLLLHRVDANQMQAPLRIVHGDVEQRPCRPGMCQGLPTCNDHSCEGHPANDVHPEERDGPMTLKVLAGYAAVLALCAWSTWQWLSR